MLFLFHTENLINWLRASFDINASLLSNFAGSFRKWRVFFVMGPCTLVYTTCVPWSSAVTHSNKIFAGVTCLPYIIDSLLTLGLCSPCTVNWLFTIPLCFCLIYFAYGMVPLLPYIFVPDGCYQKTAPCSDCVILNALLTVPSLGAGRSLV